MQRSPAFHRAVTGAEPETPPVIIGAFRHRHGLSTDQLAVLLDLTPTVVRGYEEVGGAPPWVGYALVGLEYEVFGVVPELGSVRMVEAPGVELPRTEARLLLPGAAVMPLPPTCDLAQ